MTHYNELATILKRTPEWKAWEQDNEINPRFPTAHVLESGQMEHAHFLAFMQFATRQQQLALVLRLRPYVNAREYEMQRSIDAITSL